jgi:myxalamid-type polyketide synthase MxaE and MxaD
MPMIEELLPRAPDSVGTGTPDRFVEEFNAAPERHRATMLQRRLRLEVARVLGSDSAAVGTDVGFRELGMDSLISVELRNRLEKLLGLSLVSTIAFDYPNVDALTAHLLGVYFPEVAASSAGRAAASVLVGSDGAISEKEIDDLLDISDEAAEEMLLRELRDIRGAGSNE